MKKQWRWLFRGVIGICVIFAAFMIIYGIGMIRPVVTQSNGYTGITPDAVAATLSQSLPKTAKNVRFCHASVGLAGRLMIYRFSAPVPDLHAHAQNEFAAHWDKPQSKNTPGVTSPISSDDIESYKEDFGIDAGWILPPSNALGTLYEPADGQLSHRPTIFVDETNGVLYFQMTD